jgi:hypothetical protein
MCTYNKRHIERIEVHANRDALLLLLLLVLTYCAPMLFEIDCFKFGDVTKKLMGNIFGGKRKLK